MNKTLKMASVIVLCILLLSNISFAFSFNDLFTGIFKISDEPVKNKITNLEPPIRTNKPNPIRPAEGLNINFDRVGWHYISFPFVIDNKNIRRFFCNSSNFAPEDAGQCTDVYFYNSTEQQWKHWNINTNDAINTLIKVIEGDGYWVYANDTGSMNSMTGVVIDPYEDINWGEMQPGWNSMGFTEWNVDYRMDVLIQNISDIWGKNITRVWNYSLNTDMIEPAYPNDPNAEFKINWDTGYNYGYWTCVSVPGDNDYCAKSEPPLMPWQNQRPELANNTVSPSSGDETTTFTFSVNYTDADSDLPTLKKVIIDGTPHELTLNSGLYKYSTTLTAGSHDYYFNFSDGTAHTYYDGTNTRKTETRTLNVDLPPMQPVALIITNTTTGKVPLTVEFNGLTSIDPDGSISLYEWDFNNDGITDSTNSIETHTFNTVGTFVVNLTVTDNDGFKDSDSITIIVNPDQSPTANFNYICNYLQCTFTDTSTDTDGTITNYKWDFQNDGTTDSVLKNPTFTYSADGTYTVNLTVTDDYGNKNNITKQVTVADYVNQLPTADFTYLCNNLDCTFTDLSTDSDGFITNWEWDFENDTITDSTLQNSTHTYPSEGQYTIKLTVTDNSSAKSSAEMTINVQLCNPGTCGYAVGLYGTMLKTTDAGATWMQIPKATPYSLFDTEFITSQKGWAVGALGTILKTTDSGTTWTNQTSGITKELYDVEFVDENTGWAAGRDGVIIKTTDSGSTWVQQTSGVATNAFVSIDFINATTGWIVGYNGKIIKTTNGGNTWTAQSSGLTIDLKAVDFIDANNGWATSNSGHVLKTTNGGTTWIVGNKIAYESLQGMNFVNSTTGWIATNGGKIFKTIDGGTTWVEQISGTTDVLYDIGSVNGTENYVIGSNGIILKTTNGATWNIQPTGTTSIIFGIDFTLGTDESIETAAPINPILTTVNETSTEPINETLVITNETSTKAVNETYVAINETKIPENKTSTFNSKVRKPRAIITNETEMLDLPKKINVVKTEKTITIGNKKTTINKDDEIVISRRTTVRKTGTPTPSKG